MRPLVRRSHRDQVHSVSPRRRQVRRVLLVVLMVAVGVIGTSYVRALTAPGDAPFTVRTVEWIRDSGGASIVEAIENWWYRNPPANQAPSRSDLPDLAAPSGSVSAAPQSTRSTRSTGSTRSAPRSSASSGLPGLSVPPSVAVAPGVSDLPGEAQWVAGRLDARGLPSMYTTFVQPDPAHLSIVAGIAWIRASDTVAHLVAGTAQPGGPPWPGGARVAPGDVPRLVATFNSGWRFKDLLGGFYQSGRYSRPLQQGAGSVVIDTSGRPTIGAWGQDVSMSANVASVRQNLHLIVVGGTPAPGIADASGPWGVPANQRQYTWRSGLGIDAQGNLIYVAGNHMTLRVLTNALVAAHAVRAVELDMHPNMVTFSRWMPGQGGGVTAQKLLPTMSDAADRYLQPDQRDFFYVTLR